MATKQDLLGSWRLEAWRTDYSDGRAPTFPYGADAVGTLLYTPDGRMNASIARSGRARLTHESTRLAPDAEKIAAFESYFNYAGRFELRGDSVVHAVELSLNPNFVGSEQVRRITLEGDRLTLSAEERDAKSGVVRTHRLIWRR
jgi:hypothetical protein